MFSGVRRRMSYANVVATLALVFAMSGGALAASKFLITSTKQIKPSVLAQLKGKAGKNGAPGVAGPAGAAGTQGAQGNPGGSGKDGAPGAPGENVTASEVKPSEAACSKLGGSKFVVGGKETLACNGKEGKQGPEGEPWTHLGVLPANQEEQGTWGISKITGNPGLSGVHIPISFPIRLPSALLEGNVHIIGMKETGTAGAGCGGGSSASPSAEPGNLCLYITVGIEVEPSSFIVQNLEASEEGTVELGAGRSGASVTGVLLKEGATVEGVWAVRAPE